MVDFDHIQLAHLREDLMRSVLREWHVERANGLNVHNSSASYHLVYFGEEIACFYVVVPELRKEAS